MRTERRCAKRKRPGGISYFEFEAGSGGIVLDASEKGFGFQAADAVHQLGPSRIWISPRPEERIELTGDVVWTDSSRKTGGLRFIESSADSSKKIRNWLGSQGESEASLLSQEFPPPAWAAQALGDLRDASRHDANLPHPTVVPQAKNQLEEQPVNLHPIPGVPSIFTSAVQWQSDSQSSEGRIAYKVATGFLIVVLAVAGLIFFGMFRPKVGELLIHLGERINATTNPQPQNSSPLPNSPQVPATASANNEAKQDAVQTAATPNGVQQEAGGDSEKSPGFYRQMNSQGSDSAIPRATPTMNESSERPPYRHSLGSPLDRSTEATRLWSAVGSGDSSAEVDLARLYLNGEGVPKNCEQAKVLLRAASKGGSAEARQQLKKLRTMGCR